MQKLFSLGELYVSDFVAQGQQPRFGKVELKLLMDKKYGAVRLEKSAPLNSMYGKYWYRSGINSTMRTELQSIVHKIQSLYRLKDNDVWLDIASNDGTLLSFIPSNLIRIGIDPVDDSFKKEAEKYSDLIIQDYFSAKVFKESRYGKQKAKVITSIAMFYDLEEPQIFLRDIHDVLDDNGLWVLQLSYTPLMIKQLAFDNICHEHIYYYSLSNIKPMFEDCGFQIVDCELNDVNGGSFRIWVMKKDADVSLFSTAPNRDVAQFRINSLLAYEDNLKVDKDSTWFKFFEKINELRNTTRSFIIDQKKAGKKIWGYGASTKGNTLLQYFGLDNQLIDGIAERNRDKWGLRTVGTDIPIYSEEEMRKANPDYLLILPWHFINEFKSREIEYLQRGGKFIVPCPRFEIIEL